MISVDLARSLAAAGVMWQPAAGDRFVIDNPQLQSQVFWVSNMTIELHSFGEQSLLGFNGTTEWALDSVTLDQALWLPREDQLRELIGSRIRSLTRADDDWVVTTTSGQAVDEDAECAYGRALLALC